VKLIRICHPLRQQRKVVIFGDEIYLGELKIYDKDMMV